MKEYRCIICGKNKNGLRVRNDEVLSAIRWFKKNVTKNEKGYVLTVCKEDYSKYAKEKKTYQRKQAFYVAIGLIFAALLILASGNKLIAVFYGILMVLFMYLLSLLTYTPSIEMPKDAARA